MNNIPSIDLVYLWCDSSDQKWNAKRRMYKPTEEGEKNQVNDECRFISNDELKYSLRSVSKYAPWINRIYIVSDHQTPKWLNTQNPKITMVNHEDILPKENLPLFNSSAIEMGIANISGLSEHFLYANDDSFFGNYVFPSDFFNKKGQAIFRALKNKKKISAISLYTRRVLRMQQLMWDDFGIKCDYQPHHCVDAYIKSEFLECIKHYQDQVVATTRHRFREESSFHRAAMGYWIVCKGKAVLKIIHRGRYKFWSKLPFVSKFLKSDSFFTNFSNRDGMKMVLSLRPKMFCLNDCEGTTDLDRKTVKDFMESLFPNKSEFEK